MLIPLDYHLLFLKINRKKKIFILFEGIDDFKEAIDILDMQHNSHEILNNKQYFQILIG